MCASSCRLRPSPLDLPGPTLTKEEVELNFAGEKMYSSDGKELYTIITSDMANAMKIKIGRKQRTQLNLKMEMR